MWALVSDGSVVPWLPLWLVSSGQDSLTATGEVKRLLLAGAGHQRKQKTHLNQTLEFLCSYLVSRVWQEDASVVSVGTGLMVLSLLWGWDMTQNALNTVTLTDRAGLPGLEMT